MCVLILGRPLSDFANKPFNIFKCILEFHILKNTVDAADFDANWKKLDFQFIVKKYMGDIVFFG